MKNKKRKREQKLSPREIRLIKKTVKRVAELFENGMEGPIREVEILPIGVQIDILQRTASFLRDTKKDRNGFREQIAKRFRRRDLIACSKSLVALSDQLEDTKKAVADAIMIMAAEMDSRDIGKEPSDNVLIRDEGRRLTRLERFRKRHRKDRFVQKGDEDGKPTIH